MSRCRHRRQTTASAPRSPCVTDYPYTEHESSPATLTSDRECAPLTECAASEFQVAAATATSDWRCEAVQQCGEAEYETQVCMKLLQ